MSTVSIGPDDNGQDVWLELSDSLVIELPENPTTGVRWQWDQLLGPIRLMKDSNVGPSGAGIGAASVRVLEFRAEAPGQMDLRLRRMQAWEGDSSVDAEFAVSVQVK